jgi:hypothetical protein
MNSYPNLIKMSEEGHLIRHGKNIKMKCVPEGKDEKSIEMTSISSHQLQSLIVNNDYNNSVFTAENSDEV